MRTPVLCITASLCLTFLIGTLQAKEQGDWIVRAGASYIEPASDNGALDGSDIDVEVGSATMFTFDVTYMVSDNWAVELLAAAPFEHDISLDGIGKVGSAKQLPPTLSGQYHFNPTGRIQPYAGLGFNVTLFFDESTTGALAGTDLKLDNSFGLAAQIGVDIELNENILFNAAVRYMDLETDASVDGNRVAKVKVDPWVYGINLGYRF